jgi:hypothetical protein
MKIKELLEKLDELTDEEREKWLSKLIDKFTPESLGTIANFQREWINSDKSKGIMRPFEEFRTAQNKVIRDCVKMEKSTLGAHVRVNRGLPRWDEEGELDESPLN